MKLLMVVGALWWVVIAVWVARLGMGLEHLSKDQIPAAIIGGVCGGARGLVLRSALSGGNWRRNSKGVESKGGLCKWITRSWLTRSKRSSSCSEYFRNVCLCIC